MKISSLYEKIDEHRIKWKGLSKCHARHCPELASITDQRESETVADLSNEVQGQQEIQAGALKNAT